MYKKIIKVYSVFMAHKQMPAQNKLIVEFLFHLLFCDF